jgi:hypothetical protein
VALLIDEIRPEPGERIIIFGKTGSGKTFLAERICAMFPFVIVYDAKRRIGMDSQGKRRDARLWPGFKRVTNWRDFLRALNEKTWKGEFKNPKIIYVPTPAELRSDLFINAFFEVIYTRGNCVCYVDELTAVTNRTSLPPAYHDCLVRGRELGISLFQSSQRPKDIPVNCVESSERYYVFKLKMPADVKRVADVTGLRINFLKLPKHKFWYVTEEGDKRGPLILKLGG